MKRTLLITTLLLCFAAQSQAQYYSNRNKVWAWGYGAGLDFNSGTPVPFTSSLATNEGTATMCDASGNLLFYTNGSKVYNRLGALMPHGNPGVGTASCTQAAVIVPTMTDPNKYYLFSLTEYGGFQSSLLYRFVVDMTLDGGMGDIVSIPGVLMDSLLSEKMMAVTGNGCNIWLLTHKRMESKFIARNISEAGIGAPVVSNFGPVPAGYSNIYGVMVCSPNRQLIALEIGSSLPNGTELYDFDPLTGHVSNRRVLDSLNNFYGAEFSPDNTKLYTIHDADGGFGTPVDQFDVTLPTAAEIMASRITVFMGGVGGITQLRLGPDARIYLNRTSDLSTSFMDVINNPNISGGGCGYVPHAVTLSGTTHGFLGLPSFNASPGFGIDSFVRHDTSACLASVGSINLHPHDAAIGYLWNNGDTTINSIATTYGEYWVVEGTATCHGILDSIKVIPLLDTIMKHTDTIACVRDDISGGILSAPSGGTDYLWYDGNTTTIDTIRTAGVYWVGYTINCNRFIDTFHVTIVYYPGLITGPDSICVGSQHTYHVPAIGGMWTSSAPAIASITASTGIADGVGPGATVIKYSVGSGCDETKNLTVLPMPCVDKVGNASIENSIELYPNPASDKITINCDVSLSGGAWLTMYDVTGRAVESQPLTSSFTVLSVAHLGPGIYHCRITIGGVPVDKKLVIAR